MARAGAPQGAVRKGLRAAALVALLLVGGCKAELYSGLDERDANQMVAILLDHGIAAERRRGKAGDMTVYVDEGQFSRAVTLLRSHELPKPGHASLADVFKAEGLVSSPMAEKARMIYALSEELSRTINEIDGVLSARVHIVLPTDVSLKSVATPSSASVFIRYDRATQLPDRLPQIKMLVVNSVQGLDYDHVSVVLFPVDVPVGAAANQLTNVAGLWLHAESAGRATLLLTLLLVAAAVALLAPVLAALLFWRQRRAARRSVDAEATDARPATAAPGTASVERLSQRRAGAAEATASGRPTTARAA